MMNDLFGGCFDLLTMSLDLARARFSFKSGITNVAVMTFHFELVPHSFSSLLSRARMTRREKQFHISYFCTHRNYPKAFSSSSLPFSSSQEVLWEFRRQQHRSRRKRQRFKSKIEKRKQQNNKIFIFFSLLLRLRIVMLSLRVVRQTENPIDTSNNKEMRME